jgi:hypothetical protein
MTFVSGPGMVFVLFEIRIFEQFVIRTLGGSTQGFHFIIELMYHAGKTDTRGTI